jgi:SprT protein
VITAQKLKELLAGHVPPATVDYCFQLWCQRSFDLKLRKKRRSKAGDFSCHPNQYARITLNHDLPPHEFLITYVHEVAHWHVHRQSGQRIEPHGTAWKNSFRQLLLPVMSDSIFPPAVLQALTDHMQNPMASIYSDSLLTKQLRSLDPKAKQVTLLSDLPEGSVFDFHGRWFRKGKIKRTRVLCMEIKSKRQYLVPADAPVGSAQLSLL